jgi:hypothetical protein
MPTRLVTPSSFPTLYKNSRKTQIEILEDAENELRELVVKKWRQQPNTREEWAFA